MKYIRLLMVAGSLFILESGALAHPNKPFLENSDLWGDYQGQQTMKCTNTCFPEKIDGDIPCPLRCLYTEKGFGAPTAVNLAFEKKKSVDSNTTPVFIISYGPPASGKSSVLKVLERSVDKDINEKNTVEVNVDQVFQGYSKDDIVGKNFKKYRKLIEDNEIYKIGEKKIYKQRLYTYYRWVADQISDGILNQALAGRHNVIWETTGQSVYWTQRELNRIRSYGYQTIVVYPLVKSQELLVRAKKRALEEQQEPASDEVILSGVKEAQKNLISILPAISGLAYANCPVGTTNFEIDDLSGLAFKTTGCRSDRVILIDNTGNKGEELVSFDSDIDDSGICEKYKKLKLTLKDFMQELDKQLLLFMPSCR